MAALRDVTPSFVKMWLTWLATVFSLMNSSSPMTLLVLPRASSSSVKEVLETLIELDRFEDAEIVYRPDRAAGAPALDVSSAAFSARYGWRPRVSLREGLAGTLDWYRRSAG